MNARNEILISVVIPAYNSAGYIHTALDSALGQTFKAHEILVINDGSPDTELLEQVLERYSADIRYFKTDHRGPSPARNLGIREARGDFVAFLDSDDFWFPQHLATDAAILETDPSLGLVYGDSFLVRNGQYIGRTFERESQVFPVTFETLLAEECTVSTSTCVASRNALLQAGMFDEQMSRCEDYDLWLRMAFPGTKMTHHSEVTAARTLSSSGLSADGYLMTCARVAVLAKISTTLPLSGRQQQLLAARRELNEAMAHLDRFKKCIDSGEFAAALESGRLASETLGGWRLRAALWCLTWAPNGVRYYYRAHQRRLAARNRARNERSARAIAASFPQVALIKPESPVGTVPRSTASSR